MKILTLVILLFLSKITCPGATGEKPDPWKTSEYSLIDVEGRLAAYVGLVPVILDAKLRSKSPETYIAAIESFGPA